MIGTMFIGKYIGTDGLTVMGYVAPLIMLFELIGTAVSSGSRNKVSSLIGAGELEEADRAFSASVITGACLSLFSAFLVFVFCSFVSLTLGARDPLIHEATMQYIYGYLIVRVRDDCKPFNLTEYYELIRDEQDKEKEISLSIIMKMAKDVKYTAAFGANKLIIRF